MDTDKDAMHALINEANRTGLHVADVLWATGYRLDPYPNGKSKDQLVDIIVAKQSDLTKCRIMLSEEHTRHVEESCGITIERHRELHPECPYCQFVADHSLVKS